MATQERPVARPAIATRPDRDTTLAAAGLASVAVGLALVFPPAAFVVVGALLIAYAVLPDRSPGGPTP
jgi:hypothetical protein